MDYSQQFDSLESCVKNFNLDLASELLSNRNFIINESSKILELLGNELTEDNLKTRPDIFKFWEEELLKMARTEDFQSIIYEFMDLINFSSCMLSSSVLVAITVLKKTESPDRVCLEYLLMATFDRLIKMSNKEVKDILLTILNLLSEIKEKFQKFHSVLYYFARIAFLILRVDMDTAEYLDIFSKVIFDPFCLLEQEFNEIEEKTYQASFFYLYFKTECTWGPKIYNEFYILQKCFDLTLSIFQSKDFAKPFAKLILSKFGDNEIPLYLLNKSHRDFVNEAAYCLLYKDDLASRKESMEILMLYVDKLCIDGQYVVIKYIFETLDYRIKAEFIIKMKDIVCLMIKSNQNLGYFQGIRLLDLIKICCNISDGSKCDIINNKELILAIVTVLYILYMYNDTALNMGKAFVDEANQFVKTVQNAIDFTKQKYVEEYRKLNNKSDKIINISNIPNIPKLTEKEKIDLLSQFNTALSVVQVHLDLLRDKLSN